MEDLDKYLIDEKEIRENVVTGAIGNNSESVGLKNERKTKRSKEVLKAHEEDKSSGLTDFESLFIRHSSDVRYTQLIRISSFTKMKLQRILLSKQIQGDHRIALNCFIENILAKYLQEYASEIKNLEKIILKI